MTMKHALQVILAIATAGLAFSGFLTYHEFFSGSGAETCSPVGQPGTILGYPPCIYGFFMYLAVAAFAIAGLRDGARARIATRRS
jgi:hypothetical protein